MDAASIHAGVVGFKALLDKLDAAVRGASHPRQVRRLADANAHAIREIAAADADQRLIEARTTMQIADEREEHREQRRQRALMRAEADAMREQENIENIVEKVRGLLSEGARPADMDDDWIVNVLNHARNISDETVQTVWARLIAGEANVPGSFSRRTVNVLYDLSKRDCETFAEICRFMCLIDEYPTLVIFPTGDGYYANQFPFRRLVDLDALGLIVFDGKQLFTRSQLSGDVRVKVADEEFVIRLPEGATSLVRGHVLFTQSGKELQRICDVEPADGLADYLREQWRKYLELDGYDLDDE